MRIVSWNVNSLRAREEHLLRWVKEADHPDVICLQETKVVDADFPADAIAAAGYPHQAFIGQKSYNGVAILSKLPIRDPQLGFSIGETDPQKRLVVATVEGIRIFCCYVPNGNTVGSDKFFYKLAWLDRLRAELDQLDPESDVVVCGDMNIALDDASVWDPFKCDGQLCYHPDEREKLASVLSWGLTDAFRMKNRFSSAFTWWDYRRRAFTVNQGLRIDHQFVSRPLESRVREVRIWRDVRGWDTPSDHVPVELCLTSR